MGGKREGSQLFKGIFQYSQGALLLLDALPLKTDKTIVVKPVLYQLGAIIYACS
jgi:hypothetical protein